MNKERRRRRSDKWGEAMYFQLDTCRERSTLVAMIMIDNEGYSVAESGDEQILEALYLEVERLAKDHHSFEGSLDLGPGAMDIYMEMFEVNGNTFALCAAGSDTGKRKAEVKRAQEGIGRILNGA